jgi:hypothetical protein
MRYFVQFIRFRRGVPEPIRTIPVQAEDEEAVLARVRSRVGTGTWPMNTDALRVMDNGGRTVLQWAMPPAEQQTVPSPEPNRDGKIEREPLSKGQAIEGGQPAAVGITATHHANLELGQAISYAEDGKPETWQGGYQIVNAPDLIHGEAKYTIRNADETHDRIVKEHELREDLGSRTRGQ